MTAFIDKLMEQIVSNGEMPKVQVERQISPIFDIYIEELANSITEDMGLGKGSYKLVGQEFPLSKKDGTKRSTNIDYLLYNKEVKSLLFVELKTTSDSFDYKQYKIYDDIIKKASNETTDFLYIFLKRLGSKKYKKYKANMEVKNVIKEKDWKDIKDTKLLYIAPKRILDRKWRGDKLGAIKSMKVINSTNATIPDNPKIFLLTFDKLPKLKHSEFAKEWKIIIKHLAELDNK